jgi:RNA polymerase sigma-70 factor, ECF subfamily
LYSKDVFDLPVICLRPKLKTVVGLDQFRGDAHMFTLAADASLKNIGYALVLTRNHAEAEDLVQETYVRALKAKGRLRVGSNMKAWLFTILRNVWLNQVRKRRNGPQMVEIEAGDGVADGIVEPSKDSYDLYVSKTEVEQVRRAIQELPEEFREVILLREYEDLSYQEIASVLCCPLGTVMSRLGRARAKLRTLLTAI